MISKLGEHPKMIEIMKWSIVSDIAVDQFYDGRSQMCNVLSLKMITGRLMLGLYFFFYKLTTTPSYPMITLSKTALASSTKGCTSLYRDE